ncbi:hypothetical protein BBJ29_007367 [Phytophthora kernoviae]|uniref:Uncharacterized protein n=1 Tax=Phytophthora kernoviae TaxID=325452 RepID=A0A3F2RER1_9STRA|nr:hypothetical protein BBP00_00008685 [Phytophthora kernoviae]RLN69436.1 hypothetical protein BBJ29_007367 [Phytophthora kernoviae]
MVAFSVYKASKYLFDCAGVKDPAGAQAYPTVRLDEMETLRIEAVDVVKRLDFTEVDRLIACCRQHPPQIVVGPLTDGDTTPFQDFAQYLKNRQRVSSCNVHYC